MGSASQTYNLVSGVSLPYYGARYADTIIYRAHTVEADELMDKPTSKIKEGTLVVEMTKK